MTVCFALRFFLLFVEFSHKYPYENKNSNYSTKKIWTPGILQAMRNKISIMNIKMYKITYIKFIINTEKFRS